MKAKDVQIRDTLLSGDWDQLDTFFVEQYEADYGQYFSTTVASTFKSRIKSG